MLKKSLIFAVITCLLMTFCSCGENINTKKSAKKSPEKVAEEYINTLLSGDLEEAFNYQYCGLTFDDFKELLNDIDERIYYVLGDSGTTTLDRWNDNYESEPKDADKIAINKADVYYGEKVKYQISEFNSVIEEAIEEIEEEKNEYYLNNFRDYYDSYQQQESAYEWLLLEHELLLSFLVDKDDVESICVVEGECVEGSIDIIIAKVDENWKVMDLGFVEKFLYWSGY